MINVIRSQEIPASLLRANPSYRGIDILEAFDVDFHSKCYLTESKAPANSHHFEVDHFIPQNENPNLVYEWTNLYPILEQANKIKPKSTPIGGYLDPCNDNVETEIIYSLSRITGKINFEPRDSRNLKAVNTSNLLYFVHNGRENEMSKQKAKNIQALINQEIGRAHV